MKKMMTCAGIIFCLLISVLLTSCGNGSKSHQGPLGSEATIADKYSIKLREINEKMKSYAENSQMDKAISLQNELNEILDITQKEIKSFKEQNPNGRAVPFEQKSFKDIYEITGIKFMNYNLNTSKEDFQTHFQATIIFLKEAAINEINADFVDASGNILIKESFAVGVSQWNKKIPANSEVVFYFNPNKFSKMLDFAKIIIK